MAKHDPYNEFLAALKYEINKGGYGSKYSLSIASGLTSGFISQILSIKNPKKAGRDAQYKISEAFGYDYADFIKLGSELINNNGAVINTTPIAVDPPPVNIIIQTNSEPDKEFMAGVIDRYQAIPLYESGRLAAGARGCEFDPHETPASMVVVYKPELQGCSRHKLAALKVGGNSMEPTIYKGAIVVVDLDDKEFADRKIFIVKTDEMIASVKRIGKWKGGFILISDNAKYEIEPTDLDWYQLCVGRVVWQWKDMREG